MVRLVMLLLSCLCLNALAEQHIDAYRIEAAVADQSESARTAAARATFGDVIVRVSGDSAAAQHPLVREAISNAPNYLLQFSYAADRNKEDAAKSGLKLILNYSAPAIEILLRQAQLSIWPGDRPLVLVWLVSSESGSFRKAVDEPEWQLAQVRAEVRGLPLLVAKWDAEDTQLISEQEVANLDIGKLKLASQRYKPDAILVGRYSRSGGNWKVSWDLWQGNTATHFDSPADSKSPRLGTLLANGVDQVANHFAQVYAIKSGQQDAPVQIRIDNISDFTAFKEAQLYLKSLPMIRRSELLSVEKNQLLFGLTLEGDTALLKSTLALGAKLQLDETAIDPEKPQPLLFHWKMEE
ncbi:MAG TPA: DUF2066 domain-containing protein [Cellvibrio sp.]|nr:DUF2066 domain-containing protein [Cellvibrio sp.]